MAFKTVLLREKFVEITYNELDQIIKAKWIGFLRPYEVRLGCSLMTKFIQLKNIKKHVSDHTLLKILSKDVQSYLTNEWFPEVHSIGLRKIGVILSEDDFAKETVEVVNTKSQKDDLTFHIFKNLDDCVLWLNEA